MKLVIVESPAKCSKIQGFLGPGWKVIASMGHIRALEKSLNAIGIDRDFEPTYEFMKEKSKAIKQIKEEASKADEIYLASDKDREGESIGFSVAQLLKLNIKTAKRMVFNEITKKAIINASENTTTIDMAMVHAQQARAMLDMMIGFTLSPLLWKYISRGSGLSAGRCQTTALRLVVERENQIAGFKSVSSWGLSSHWRVRGFKELFGAQMDDELEDEESAVNYMEQVCEVPTGVVIANDVRPWTEGAPQPLITSTLQQQASALYHISPKQTMQIAQRLYESGYITYHRTDHAILSEEAREATKKWIRENYGEEYIGNEEGVTKTKNVSTKSEKVNGKRDEKGKEKEKEKEGNAQEAHEAIRPVHVECSSLSSEGKFGENIKDHEWTAFDRKIYGLIWQRTVQSVMSLCRGESCKVKMQIDGDEDFTWSSSWKRTTFDGWKKAGKIINIDEESESDSSDESSDWSLATSLKVGTKVEWVDMKAGPRETKAQGRYTEATLVRELEKHGIGRPSTFASLMSTIQDRGYVEIKDIPPTIKTITEYTMTPAVWPASKVEIKKKIGAEKHKLVPTELGRCALEFMLKHFEDLFSYGFTGTMEKRLDKIAEGKEEWKQVLRDMWESYKDRYEKLLNDARSDGVGVSSDKVKEFGEGLKAVLSKKGPLLLVEGATKDDTLFLGWPAGISFGDMTIEKARAFYTEWLKQKDASCLGEWNGAKIEKKSGKFGEYLQCGDVSIPFIADESYDDMVGRFEAKKNGSGGGAGIIRAFKHYEIRTGPYGPYMFKTSLKKRVFVSFPKNINIEVLTEKDIEALYKAGLEAKEQAKKWAKK